MAGAQGSALAIAVSQCRRTGIAAVRDADARCMRAGADSDHRRDVEALQRQLLLSSTARTRSRARGRVAQAAGAVLRRARDRAGRRFRPGPGRVPFNAEAADVLEEFKPPVVSFHFGLPSKELLGAREAMGREDPLVGDDARRSALSRGPWRRCGDRPGLRSRRTSRPVPVERRQHAGRDAGAHLADRQGGQDSGDRGRRHRGCDGGDRGQGRSAPPACRSARHTCCARGDDQRRSPRGVEDR